MGHSDLGLKGFALHQDGNPQLRSDSLLGFGRWV